MRNISNHTLCYTLKNCIAPIHDRILMLYKSPNLLNEPLVFRLRDEKPDALCIDFAYKINDNSPTCIPSLKNFSLDDISEPLEGKWREGMMVGKEWGGEGKKWKEGNNGEGSSEQQPVFVCSGPATLVMHKILQAPSVHSSTYSMKWI